MYSRTQLLTGFVNKWSIQIDDEVREYNDLKRVLQHLESPFGFIEGFQLKKVIDRDAQDRKDQFADRVERNDWISDIAPDLWQRVEALDPMERSLEAKVDIITEKISRKMGYDEIPWLYFTWNCLLVYLLCTCLVMFYKADFIN